MARRVNISYHTYANLRDCRFRYKLQVVDRVPSVKPVDNRNAIFGFVTQRLFELFYKNEWFKLGAGATQKLYDELPGVLREQLAKNVCLWEHRAEVQVLISDCQQVIPLFIRAVKQYSLIGEENLSEYDISYDLTTQFRLTGRVDFLLRKRKDVILLDGKGTKYDMKYLDVEQLLFYVLVMKLSKARLPTKAGFWLWREGEIRWVDISENLVADLYTKVKEVLFLLQKGDMSPNPCSRSCRFCPYMESQCPAYQTWHRANQDRISRSRMSRMDLPEASAAGGVVEIV